MRINTKYVMLIVLALFQFSAIAQENSHLAQQKASLYYRGKIITMEGDSPVYVDAVVEQAGKIVYAGSKQKAENAYSHARMVNLTGKTLLPGFIEPHLHPSIAALMLPNDTIAPHQWKKPNGISKATKTPKAFQQQLKQSIANAPENKMHFIWGYHQLWHGELSRELLNKYAGENKPVGIIHRSFHEIYLNDAAIKLFNISENDFANNPQVNWQKGHFYEGGWLALVPKIGSVLLDPANYQKGLAMMTELMLQNGITTIAEPGFPSSDFKMEYAFLKNEMNKQPPYDIYLIPNGTQLYGMAGNSNEKAEKQMQGLAEKYNTDNIFFLPQQVKLFADGAIYSLAMQMNEPYLSKQFHGEWMTPLELFQQQLSFYWSKGYKIHVHANGDKGIQQVVDFNKADQKTHPRENHRFTLHHMGYFDANIAEQINSLNIEASVNPFYLWALSDKYSENGLGPQRAENLVRVKELTKRNIPVSFHSDFAMAPAEPLTLAWTAINRVTSENSAFSQDQRLDVYTAMKGITIDAARTLNLEDKIGSIKVGKIANFTILKENPFTVDPMKIKDIPVAAVVYKGKWVQNKH